MQETAASAGTAPILARDKALLVASGPAAAIAGVAERTVAMLSTREPFEQEFIVEWELVPESEHGQSAMSVAGAADGWNFARRHY